MKGMIQSVTRRNFNASSHGGISHITDEHRALFLAMTGGAPNFCLTSCYVNGQPAVMIVLADRRDDNTLTLAPCFVTITPGMKLRTMDGQEYEWSDG